MNAVAIADVSKKFVHGHDKVLALSHVSLTLEGGQSLAICGRSGAGKSTLLTLIGGLDTPTQGQVIVMGNDYRLMKDGILANFRNRRLGFVFQFHHLLHDFTVLENIMMPLLIAKVREKEAKKTALTMCERVGILETVNRFPQELSGGEQQRAAIARAVIHKPQIILADEPTGNLDVANGRLVFDLLCGLNHDLGATLVVVTHNQDFARRMQKILVLADGKVKEFR